METYQVGLIALAIAALGIYVAYRSWMRQVQLQEQSLPKPIAFSVGDLEIGIDCFYVASTFEGSPLSRVKGYTLGSRGRARLFVTDLGIGVFRYGELSFLIPKSELSSVSTSSAVIGKAVERDGIVSIEWSLGDKKIDTHLRFVSSSSRKTFLEQTALVIGGSK